MSVRSKPLAVFLCILSFGFAVTSLAAAADPIVHTVQKGETLYAIARKYDVSVDVLMKENRISDAARLFVGMKLTIPGTASPAPATGPASATTAEPGPSASKSVVEYVVKKGDTLYSVARAHGASVDAIAKESGLSGSSIKAGQKLKIPVVSAGPGASGQGVASKPDGGKPEAGKPAGSSSSGSSSAISPLKPASSPVSSAASKSWPAAGSVSFLQGKLKGVSIAAEPASSILAVRSGAVISAGPFRGFDLVAFVQAPDGLVYVYGGASTLAVRVGDSVRKGSLVGKVGSSADATAYFFIFKGADTIDPSSAPRD